MGNLVIATGALSDVAAITAGSEVDAMPAANLLRTQPGDRWRTEGLASLYVEADLGAAASINLIALMYHSATSAATWRIRGATNQANLTAAPGYDSGAINMWDAGWPTDQDPLHSLKWLGASPQNYRWWRIDITDAANPDGYIEAGRLYLSSAWQLPASKNIEYGWEMQFQDPSRKARSEGGQLFAERKAAWRELRCTLNWLTEDEMYGNFYELQRRFGISRDVLVIRDPNATTHLLRQTVYGQLRDIQPIVHAQAQIFRSRFVVEEMRQ